MLLPLVWICSAGAVYGQTETETNPIVLSIRARDPQTGEQLAEAVRMLLDAGRADVATPYVEKMSRLSLDDAGWFQVARQAGPDFAFRMATDPRIQPQGRQLAEQILVAADRFASDPARLDQLVERVDDPDITVRSTALDDLRAVGEPGAAALLNAIADPAREGPSRYQRLALSQFGEAARGPIIGGIRAAEPRMRLAAIEAAGHYLSSDIVAQLLRPLFDPQSAAEVRDAAERSLDRILPHPPTRTDAVEMLTGKTHQYLETAPANGIESNSTQTLYRLNPETSKLVRLTRSTLVAHRMQAAEAAEDLLHIAAGNPAVEREYVLALLEAAKYVRGFEVPIMQTPALATIDRVTPAAMATVLREALKRNLNGAAMGACEALGRLAVDDPSNPDVTGALVDAVKAADVRVRFAACQALMTLDPQRSFAGSSDVLATMIELAACQGRSKVLIAIPQVNEAQTVAATLDKLGYEAETVTSARQLLHAAAEDPDVRWIMISDRLNPSVSQVIDHLRNHPKSRRTPVAVLYRSDEEILAQRGGAARQDILVHLVIDVRNFVGYDRWLQAYMQSEMAERHPLLLVVRPGDTAVALGWSGQTSQVRFFELDEQIPLVSTSLLERVRESFRLNRNPVCLAVEPVSTSTPATMVSTSLVVDPSEWPDWAQWTRLLHDNSATDSVDVVIADPTELRRYQSLERAVESTPVRTIDANDIEFLFQLVVGTISTEKALWTSYIDPEAQRRALVLEQTHQRVIAVPASRDARLISRQVDRVNQWMEQGAASPPQLQWFAEQAGDWLLQIASQPERYPFWDLARQDNSLVAVARNPNIGPAICRALGHVGTPQAQEQLLLVVEQQQRPMAVRQAAVEGFQTAVDQHGIFLTSDQIRRQYDRYNASASLPAEVQQLYGAILDVLERPTSK